MQRRLLSSADSHFGVVLQQSRGGADSMPTVVVHLDTPAQQHEIQELQTQVGCHTCSPSLSKSCVNARTEVMLEQYMLYPVFVQHRYAGCYGSALQSNRTS